MTTTAEVAGIAAPTLEQEMRGTMLLFGMFGLACLVLAAAVGVVAAISFVTG